jgi:hydroxyacylglutathione hydrolase
VWIVDHVHEIKAKGVSMFVYTADNSPICFDTGLSEDAVKRGFEALGSKPDRVKHVFLTRTDRDHVGGLKLFVNAHVYLSIDKEQMINKTTARFLGFVHNPPFERPYPLLKNGEVVQVGLAKIEALATPGHTPGSMSYLVDDAILFVGDTLILRKGRARHFSRLHLRDLTHMDIATQNESAKKLAQLKKVSLMATAHSGFTTEYESAMSGWT